MKISNTQIPAVKLIEPAVFEDERGFFFESYRISKLREAGVTEDFVQDNISKSSKGTIRGLHYQLEQPQGKLVQCITGEILDIAVDLRRSSKTFGKTVSVVLSGENHHQLYVPSGFAHGFSVLSEIAIVHYKCSSYYHKPSERGIRWNDPDLGINWQIEHPILSEKDQVQPYLSSLSEKDLF